MKKRKLILAIILTLFTTGCSINYDLTIEDGNIQETTTFIQDNNDTEDSTYIYSKYLEEYPIYIDEEFLYYDPNKKVEGNTYYDKSITENTNGYNATYKAQFKIKEYKRSRLLNTAFNNHSIGYDKKEGCYYIIVDDIKTFEQLNTVTNINISITLNGYEVVESNQDSKNNNTYTWNFDKDDQKSIIIKYKKETKDNIQEPEEKQNTKELKESKYTLYIFCGILLIIIIVGYSIFKKIKNNNDSFDI